MGEEQWKKIESVIRRAFNNKRNNTVETMKLAFKRKSEPRHMLLYNACA